MTKAYFVVNGQLVAGTFVADEDGNVYFVPEVSQ